jgi:2,3-dihydroxybenzoate decarboxylase
VARAHAGHTASIRTPREYIMTMANKIALEEHFSIEGMNYKNDVMDAPTFVDVRYRLLETESLRLDEMDKAGIQVSILSFFAPGIQAETDPDVAVQHAKRANDLAVSTRGSNE